MRKTYRMIFHGPNNDPECRRAIAKFARQFSGKVSYTSFWVGRRNEWHSEDTVGKAAYSAVIPTSFGVDAIRRVRHLDKELIPGKLRYIGHH